MTLERAVAHEAHTEKGDEHLVVMLTLLVADLNDKMKKNLNQKHGKEKIGEQKLRGFCKESEKKVIGNHQNLTLQRIEERREEFKRSRNEKNKKP